MQRDKRVSCIENMVKRCCIILPDEDSSRTSQDIPNKGTIDRQLTSTTSSDRKQRENNMKEADTKNNTLDEQKMSVASENHGRSRASYENFSNLIPASWKNKQWILIGFSIASMYLLGIACITCAIFSVEEAPVLILVISGCVFIGQASIALYFSKTLKASLALIYKYSSTPLNCVRVNWC